MTVLPDSISKHPLCPKTSFESLFSRIDLGRSDVKDVVDATIRALKGTFQSRMFNFGSGTETTIGNLAETMQGLVGRRPGVKFLPPRLGDPYRGVADITKAQRELGFNPRTSLRDGLSETIQWYNIQKQSTS